MSIEAFIENPWKESHPTYENRTFFHIRPAPEFATAEVVVASLYRAAGYEGLSEKDVPSAGREFAKDSLSQKVHDKSGSKIDLDTWRVVLHGVLESPKQPNQSSKRFLQMCPVVPNVALYSGSARLAGNSWNPGELVRRMFKFGSLDAGSAGILWERLFESLSVSDGDDIWARWLSQEFELRRKGNPAWKLSGISSEGDNFLPSEEKAALDFPAKQFARDVEGILQAKPFMTRRQWVSLLEAVLRIGTVAHVLWLCDVNYKAWLAIKRILNTNEPPPSEAEVKNGIVSCNEYFFTYGNPAVPIARDYASRYLVARIGINAVLWQLKAGGFNIESISSCAELTSFLKKVSEHKAYLNAAGIEPLVTDLQEGEKNARAIACKKGIGSNLVEFVRHVLGQRQTASDILRGYDQGYVLRKKGEYASAPWIVSMGPVAILALVHCCLKDAAGPRSIQKLCEHLGLYGIRVNRDDVTSSDLGRKLRMLGLVLDSPDAESGMLLIPPFGAAAKAAGGTK
jgi:hypothetical protein